LKFQKLVEEEQGSKCATFISTHCSVVEWPTFSFLTRLHHGQVSIIPWPVIESKKFYSSLSILHKMLFKQKITHRTGGVFLHTLKTLMAKLKVSEVNITALSELTCFSQTNDWGALDRG
jgi:hypothetical protein